MAEILLALLYLIGLAGAVIIALRDRARYRDDYYPNP